MVMSNVECFTNTPRVGAGVLCVRYSALVDIRKV